MFVPRYAFSGQFTYELVMFSKLYATLHLGVLVYTWESPCLKFLRMTRVHDQPPETSKVYLGTLFGVFVGAS